MVVFCVFYHNMKNNYSTRRKTSGVSRDSAMDWMFVSSQNSCWIIPNMMLSGDRGFRRWWDHKGGAPMNEISALRKETSKSFLTLPPCEDRSRRWPAMTPLGRLPVPRVRELSFLFCSSKLRINHWICDCFEICHYCFYELFSSFPHVSRI